MEFWNRIPELSCRDQLLRQTGSLGAQALALPTNTKMYQLLIVADRWFANSDNDPKVLVLNTETAELNDIKVGDKLKLSLYGQPNNEWQVIAYITGLLVLVTP